MALALALGMALALALALALGMALKFYTSVAKGLKLKVRKFWGLTPAFVEVTGKKLVGGLSKKAARKMTSTCPDI